MKNSELRVLIKQLIADRSPCPEMLKLAKKKSASQKMWIAMWEQEKERSKQEWQERTDLINDLIKIYNDRK